LRSLSDPDARLECPGTLDTTGTLTLGALGTGPIIRRRGAASNSNGGRSSVSQRARNGPIKPDSAPLALAAV